MASSKRKYVLFKQEDGRPDSEKPCAFFASEEGCKNGSNCKFSHQIGNKTSEATCVAPMQVFKESSIHKVSDDSTSRSTKKRKDKPDVNDAYNAYAPPISVNSGPVLETTSNLSQSQSAVIEERIRTQQQLFEQRLREQQEEFDRNMQTQLQEITQQQQLQQQNKQQQQQLKYHDQQLHKDNTASRNSNVNSNNSRRQNGEQQQQRDVKPQGRPDYRNQRQPQPKQLLPAQLTTQASVTSTTTFFQPLVSTNILSSSPPTSLPTAIVVKPQHQPIQSDNYLNTPPDTNNQIDNDDDDDEDDDIAFSAVSAVVGNHERAGLAFASPPPFKTRNIQDSQAQSRSKSVVHPPPGFTLPVANITPAPTPTASQSSLLASSASSTVRAVSTVTVDSVSDRLLSRLPPTPFLPPGDAIRALTTSNSSHALHGSRKPSALNVSSPGYKPSYGLALPWEQLVLHTRSNAMYKAAYSFVSDSSWVSARPPGDWCRNLLLSPLLALDCEMCESTDPVTGDRDPKTLIRVSVVDGLDPTRVLLDTLVQPSWPITDLRTSIHGITEEALAQAPPFSLRHAQAALAKLCTNATVLVGHSLYNDLTALKFAHSLVIDTAFLFQREGALRDSPSLREVASSVLDLCLPTTHDSVRDAAAAMQLASFVQKHGPQPPVPRASAGPSPDGSGKGTHVTVSGDCELLVHRLPDKCSCDDLLHMIISHCMVVPLDVFPMPRAEQGTVPLTPGAGTGKAVIRFTTAAHCSLAFESIAGPVRKDNGGRPQKRIYLKKGGYICVRVNT